MAIMTASCKSSPRSRRPRPSVSRRSDVARGTLRISALTSFGRLHVAPHLRPFLEANPGLVVNLTLSDDFVDLVKEGVDVAIRIAELTDLEPGGAPPRPQSPAALRDASTIWRSMARPASVADLSRHCTARHGRPGPVAARRPGRAGDGAYRRAAPDQFQRGGAGGRAGRLSASRSRSTWDVGPELRAAASSNHVLPGYRASRRVAVHAVYPSRRHLAAKVRLFIDHLASRYGEHPAWDDGLEAVIGVDRPAQGLKRSASPDIVIPGLDPGDPAFPRAATEEVRHRVEPGSDKRVGALFLAPSRRMARPADAPRIGKPDGERDRDHGHGRQVAPDRCRNAEHRRALGEIADQADDIVADRRRPRALPPSAARRELQGPGRGGSSNRADARFCWDSSTSTRARCEQRGGAWSEFRRRQILLPALRPSCWSASPAPQCRRGRRAQ